MFCQTRKKNVDMTLVGAQLRTALSRSFATSLSNSWYIKYVNKLLQFCHNNLLSTVQTQPVDKMLEHYYCYKSAAGLLQALCVFTSVGHSRHRMKNHICTHIGTRGKNANSVNAAHLLWCKFMCKCFKPQRLLKDIR